MRFKLGYLAVLFLLPGCASQDAWTRQDTVMQLVVTGTLMVDAINTSDIHNHANVKETGFARHFLGDQPDPLATFGYFAGAAVIHYMAARAMPAKWRPWFQGVVIVSQARNIYNACQLNIGVCRE